MLQYLPILIDKVEKICEANGLRNDAIVMRMTGCPNGCARPYVAGASYIPLITVRLLMLSCRGRLCRESTWYIFHATWRWLLRTTNEQDLQRYLLSRCCFTGLGTYASTFAETVTEPEILAILNPMIKRYALERLDGERFGDFTIRAGYIAPTTSGKEWYDKMGGEGQNKENVAS